MFLHFIAKRDEPRDRQTHKQTDYPYQQRGRYVQYSLHSTAAAALKTAAYIWRPETGTAGRRIHYGHNAANAAPGNSDRHAHRDGPISRQLILIWLTWYSDLRPRPHHAVCHSHAYNNGHHHRTYTH